MTDKEKIRNIIELFIAWNGETEVIDVANLDSAIDFIADSLQEEPVSKDLHHVIDTKAKELWDEINTGHEYSILDSYNQFIGICMEIAESIKEKPVSIKDKLRALSDGKQHLGWIDDAMALEMGEELAKEVEDYIDVNGFDGLDSVEEVKSIACHFANWQKEKLNYPFKDNGNPLNDEIKDFTKWIHDQHLTPTIALAAYHFANWQKEQMMKEAIDAQVLENYDGKVIKYDETILDEKLSDCKVFDKVKVIVIKEN